MNVTLILCSLKKTSEDLGISSRKFCMLIFQFGERLVVHVCLIVLAPK